MEIAIIILMSVRFPCFVGANVVLMLECHNT